MKISKKEAKEIIQSYKLIMPKKINHYRFNELFWSEEFVLKKNNNKILLFDKLYYPHSPPLIFTNSETVETNKINFSLNTSYNKNDRSQRKIFWYLKLSSLNNYLDRRTKIASKPSKHFPTNKTYEKINNKINGSILIEPFDLNKFDSTYNEFKNKNYQSGKNIYYNLINRYKKMPLQWLKSISLISGNKVRAIALLVDDGKSISLENIASERSNLSYGIFLCTQIIDHYSSLEYYSFDAGISNIYGVYKDKIFLDSYEVNINNFNFFQYIKNLIN